MGGLHNFLLLINNPHEMLEAMGAETLFDDRPKISDDISTEQT